MSLHPHHTLNTQQQASAANDDGPARRTRLATQKCEDEAVRAGNTARQQRLRAAEEEDVARERLATDAARHHAARGAVNRTYTGTPTTHLT